MEIKLPALEAWQKAVYDDVTASKASIYVVKSKRQVGKTILAVCLVLFYAFRRKSVSVIVEPTLNQSRRVFKQITSLLQGTGLVKASNASLLSIDLINGSELLFKSAEQEDALRGFTVSGILVIDEAAFIKDAVFDILFPTTDVHKAAILIISTPLFCDGRFFSLFESGRAGKEGIASYDWGKYDTSKYLSPDKLEMYRQQMTPNKFKSEYLGEFITEGSYIFGDVRACIGTTTKPPVRGGIDFGAGGGDYTVLTLMDDECKVTHLYHFNEVEPVRQVELLAAVINRHPTLTKVLCEKNSIGAVYLDYLKKSVQRPHVLEEFQTTNDSKREVIEDLVKAFQLGSIAIPDDDELITELQHYAVDRTATGKLTYNGESGYHDDCVISLALALKAGKASEYAFSFGNRGMSSYR